MNNLGARVTDVNHVAEQLLSSDSCDKDQIHQTRDQLNNRSEQSSKGQLNSHHDICGQPLVLLAFRVRYFLS